MEFMPEQWGTSGTILSRRVRWRRVPWIRESVQAESIFHVNELIRCIALRTMVTKDGIAYLQAGGGIVFGMFSHSLRTVMLCHH